MSDTISRHGVSAWLDNLGYSKLADYVMDEDRFSSAEPEILKDGTLVIGLTLEQLDKVNRVLLESGKWCKLMYMGADEQPERPKGEWIKNPEYIGDDTSGFIDNHFSCSECKKEAEINSWGFYILSDFCPNCGADMREGE